MKKQILCIISILTIVSFSEVAVFAADAPGEKSVPVIYDTRNIIPDPDHPDDGLAEWGVAVPSYITFTKENKEVPVDVELVGINGHTLDELTPTFKASVAVKSANTMKLEIEGAIDKDATSYNLIYGANVVDSSTTTTPATKVQIAELSKVAATGLGTAKLIGISKVSAAHRDTLTYVVTKSAS